MSSIQVYNKHICQVYKYISYITSTYTNHTSCGGVCSIEQHLARDAFLPKCFRFKSHAVVMSGINGMFIGIGAMINSCIIPLICKTSSGPHVVSTHIHTPTDPNPNPPPHTHTHTHTPEHTHTYTHTPTHTLTPTQTQTHTYTHLNTPKHLHTHTHTYTHTH